MEKKMYNQICYYICQRSLIYIQYFFNLKLQLHYQYSYLFYAIYTIYVCALYAPYIIASITYLLSSSNQRTVELCTLVRKRAHYFPLPVQHSFFFLDKARRMSSRSAYCYSTVLPLARCVLGFFFFIFLSCNANGEIRKFMESNAYYGTRTSSKRTRYIDEKILEKIGEREKKNTLLILGRSKLNSLYFDAEDLIQKQRIVSAHTLCQHVHTYVIVSRALVVMPRVGNATLKKEKSRVTHVKEREPITRER